MILLFFLFVGNDWYIACWLNTTNAEYAALASNTNTKRINYSDWYKYQLGEYYDNRSKEDYSF
jgi:hypothetical protein